MNQGDALLVTQSVDRVRAFVRGSGMRKADIARKASLPKSTLTGIAADDWNPRVKTVRAIEAIIPKGWQPGDPLPDETAKDAA